MTSLDTSKYTATASPASVTSRLATAKPNNSDNSPVSMVMLGIGAVVVLASGISAIPGMQQQFANNQAVQARLNANGLSLLEGKELESALKISTPVVSVENRNELALIGWEEIIRNPNFPAGTYVTKNSVVVKAVNGAKGFQDVGQSSGHQVGTIKPEIAQARLLEYQHNVKKLGAQ